MTQENTRSHLERPEFQGFREYYEKEIAPWTAEQADKMVEEQEKTKRIWLIGLPLVLLAVFGLYMVDISFRILFFAAVGGIAAVFIWAQSGMRRLQKNVDAFLLDKICGFLNLRYSPDAGDFPFERFRSAEMLPYHNRRSLTNSIFGNYAGVDFGLAGCLLKSMRGRRSSTTTEFRGLLYMLAFPRKFEGRILVTPDKGSIGNFFKGLGKCRVVIDDSAFEQRFAVFATDEEEARQLLTPAVTGLIGEFSSYMQHEQERSIAAMAFLEDRLLLAVNEEGSPLLGSAGNVDCPERVDRLLEEIKFVFDIIDTLKIGKKAS